MRRPAILLRYTADHGGTEEAPVVRIHNSAEALTTAADHLARQGIAWRPPEAVESLGVLGYRLWFGSASPGPVRATPQPLDVRLDGQVRFTTE